jgi:hypothetical protein
MRKELLLVAVLGAAACATASGEVSGGDPKTEPVVDAGGAPVDAGPTTFPEDLVDAGSGTTWTALYRDLFGPTGVTSCAGNGTCHGGADQAGAKSAGFLCADQKGCRQSLVDVGQVRTRDTTAPDKSLLVLTLRHRADSGNIVGIMPKTPPFVFPRSAMDRVKTWIAAGFPDD